MPESSKPFVITDRRKFTPDGQPRPDADPSPERERTESPRVSAPVAVTEPETSPADSTPAHVAEPDEERIPGPTSEQMEQSRLAYEATAERLDIAIRAANPGADHPPATSFVQIVQSIYMTAIMQLGGGTPEGQQPQIDILGARQSIDMLSVLVRKTDGNLTSDEAKLLESALFELRMAFLEITQSLARSAAAQKVPPAPGPGRPSIVR